MELFELVAQTALVGLLAGWLITGAYQNIQHPSINRDLVRDVCSMRAMEMEAPEIYQEVKKYRITSQRFQDTAFWSIVIVETVVSISLAIGTLLLLVSIFGGVSAEYSRLFAAWAVLGFTMIWGAFLVGGNWFHYWVAHKPSQHTHYFMTIWGIVTLAWLV